MKARKCECCGAPLKGARCEYCGTDDYTGRGSIPIHYLINNINLVIEVIGNIHEK